MAEDNKSVLLIFSLIIFLFISLLNFVSADVISLNSGGNEEFVLNPDKYIEGFFFGEGAACVPDTCAGLGYNCGSWSDGCGGTINCGTCASGYTCTAGICVWGGAGGGGGGGGEITYNFLLSPTEFNIDMAINTNVKKTITITNLEDFGMTLGVTQFNLNKMVIFDKNSLALSANQRTELEVIFVAPDKPGIYTGRILIGGKTIFVTLNVKTELLLFDSNIVVLNENYEVRQGDQLKTMVTLIPLGDPTRLDVTLNFVIKDYANEIYLTKSETLLVEEQVKLKRNFDTGTLPLGNYVIGLELVYPGGVAPSSAHFKVIEKPFSSILGKIILFLIILILLIAIIIIAVLIIRRIREKKKANAPPASPAA